MASVKERLLFIDETFTGEALVQCIVCKDLQSISFVRGQLIPTRKYVQRDNYVYHECGSSSPCHLFLTTV
jgi:hypothetical protein